MHNNNFTKIDFKLSPKNKVKILKVFLKKNQKQNLRNQRKSAGVKK